jgi:BlaI family transcriptional regulator, penicillinase repressor
MEILRVVWQKGEAPVREVHAALVQARPVAVTTVASMMQLMEQKGLLALVDQHRPFRYRAALDPSGAKDSLLAEVINRAFEGSARDMVLHLLAGKKASPQQLKQVEQVMDELGEGA